MNQPTEKLPPLPGIVRWLAVAAHRDRFNPAHVAAFDGVIECLLVDWESALHPRLWDRLDTLAGGGDWMPFLVRRALESRLSSPDGWAPIELE
jgi:hypothetical protein